jgi:hypothetical protein
MAEIVADQVLKHSNHFIVAVGLYTNMKVALRGRNSQKRISAEILPNGDDVRAQDFATLPFVLPK